MIVFLENLKNVFIQQSLYVGTSMSTRDQTIVM